MTSGFGYQNYILFNNGSPNYGPYGKRYPSIISHNGALLNGIRPTPLEFTDTGNGYVSARQTYIRAKPEPSKGHGNSVLSSGERLHLKKIS